MPIVIWQPKCAQLLLCVTFSPVEYYWPKFRLSLLHLINTFRDELEYSFLFGGWPTERWFICRVQSRFGFVWRSVSKFMPNLSCLIAILAAYFRLLVSRILFAIPSICSYFLQADTVDILVTPSYVLSQQFTFPGCCFCMPRHHCYYWAQLQFHLMRLY